MLQSLDNSLSLVCGHSCSKSKVRTYDVCPLVKIQVNPPEIYHIAAVNFNYKPNSSTVHCTVSLHLYISTSLHLYISTPLHLYISTSLHLYISTSLHHYSVADTRQFSLVVTQLHWTVSLMTQLSNCQQVNPTFSPSFAGNFQPDQILTLLKVTDHRKVWIFGRLKLLL